MLEFHFLYLRIEYQTSNNLLHKINQTLFLIKKPVFSGD